MSAAEQHVDLLEQAEASVLGGALYSEPFAALMLARVSEEDFRRDAHRVIYRAIAACSRSGRHGQVDVTEWLIDSGQVDEVGGPVAVSQLASRNLSRDAFRSRLAKVESAGNRRRMREAGLKLVKACEDWSNSDEQLTSIAVQSVLEANLGSDIGGVVTAHDLDDEVEHILSGDSPSDAVDVSWTGLRDLYRPAPGRWTVVGGIPGHGKSSFMDALMMDLATRHGWRFLICSPEKQPTAQHVVQLVQLHAGVPVLGRTNRPDVSDSKRFVDTHFSWLELGDNGRDVASVLSMARLEHLMEPFQGLVVDPWNELDHSRDRALSETEHVSQSLTRFRSFCRRHDVHGWMVAHPTKLPKQTTTEGDVWYPVPSPYDISGSANWRNKADNALALWRDVASPYDPSQVHVQKVRFQPWEGREGMCELRFDTSTGRFVEGRI